MTTEYDVIISGYGPVGQTAANFLGKDGHRVLVLEQWAGIYHLPRAAHIDHEIMRIIQAIGKADDIHESLLTCDKYKWINQEGETLIEFDFNLIGKSGWPSDYLIYQPRFEDVLHNGAKRYSNVNIRNNAKVVFSEEVSDGVIVEHEDMQSGEKFRVKGSYLLGCDGANSYVRQAAGISYTNLGFDESWLVVDIFLKDRKNTSLPSDPEQHCNPLRPVTVCPMPDNRYRWEFMMMPGETKAEMVEDGYVWKSINPWGVTRENADIERATVYTFNSKIAPQWTKGRLLLAGDACHLTPPFLGQGMAMGMRDAINISWKLDLVLRGVCPEKILDDYGPERIPQVTEAIKLAVDLGNVVCEKDIEKVKIRDEEMLKIRESGINPIGENTITFPDLLEGIIKKDKLGNRVAPAGDLFVQGKVDAASVKDTLLETITGPGFLLLAKGFDPSERMTAIQRDLWKKLGGHIVTIGEVSSTNAISVAEASSSSVYADWLSENECVAVLMRPDFYIYGVAKLPTDISKLIDDLSSSLYIK